MSAQLRAAPISHRVEGRLLSSLGSTFYAATSCFVCVLRLFAQSVCFSHFSVTTVLSRKVQKKFLLIRLFDAHLHYIFYADSVISFDFALVFFRHVFHFQLLDLILEINLLLIHSALTYKYASVAAIFFPILSFFLCLRPFRFLPRKFVRWANYSMTYTRQPQLDFVDEGWTIPQPMHVSIYFSALRILATLTPVLPNIA